MEYRESGYSLSSEANESMYWPTTEMTIGGRGSGEDMFI